MKKRKQKPKKPNPVMKNMERFNKPKTHKNKKREAKFKGYSVDEVYNYEAKDMEQN
mgnify:CR=1 FL=1|jgi:hypothetical protein|tara:strand:+ start:781 stop:948 length:168 start_codon:yes stop_codon:yes gene_type:complete